MNNLFGSTVVYIKLLRFLPIVKTAEQNCKRTNFCSGHAVALKFCLKYSPKRVVSTVIMH